MINLSRIALRHMAKKRSKSAAGRKKAPPAPSKMSRNPHLTAALLPFLEDLEDADMVVGDFLDAFLMSVRTEFANLEERLVPVAGSARPGGYNSNGIVEANVTYWWEIEYPLEVTLGRDLKIDLDKHWKAAIKKSRGLKPGAEKVQFSAGLLQELERPLQHLDLDLPDILSDDKREEIEIWAAKQRLFVVDVKTTETNAAGKEIDWAESEDPEVILNMRPKAWHLETATEGSRVIVKVRMPVSIQLHDILTPFD